MSDLLLASGVILVFGVVLAIAGYDAAGAVCAGISMVGSLIVICVDTSRS